MKIRVLNWNLFKIVAALALFVALVPFCSGQQLTGNLSGTAEDVSGAVIPKASVVLKNQASGDVRTTITDNSGYFSISAVPPATYSITISAAGFTTWEERDLVMNQGDSREVANIKLKIGTSKTEVEVVSGADAVVPTDTAEISTTLNTEMIQDITIAGRDAGELLKIMPGMALTNGLSQGSGFNAKVTGTNNGPVGAYSANGTQPNGAMAYMLDGANLVDPGNAGTQIANINQDMTAEVKVLMSDYSAEYAKGPVIFEAFSKSGGSQFHGEGYFYAKNSTFDSIDAFAKSQIASNETTGGETASEALAGAKASEHYYYMGGNVGGPILIPFTNFNKSRKKLFFWAGYEYMSQHPAGTPVLYNVPNQCQLGEKAGDPNLDFTNSVCTIPSGVPNSSNSYAYTSAQYNLPTGVAENQIPTSYVDPNITGLIAEGAYPLPTLTASSTNGWNNYEYVSSVPQNRWEATGKVDYAINDNTKVTGSYTRQIENDQHPISIWWVPPWTLPYPSDVSAPTVSQEVMTNFTHVFNPTTTNEFVYTLARYVNPNNPTDPKRVDRSDVGFNVPGLFGHTASQIPNVEGPWGGAFPNIENFSFDGSFNGGSFGALKTDPAFYDNFSKVVGSHTMKAGFYWDESENNQSNSGGLGSGDQGTFNLGWGAYGTGNVVADFLLGRTANYAQQNSIPVQNISMHQWSLYAQDSWKAGNQLTINYGLRLDHMGQWYDTPGFQVWNPSTYVNSTSAPANTGLEWHAIDSSIPYSGWKSPLFYPEPRVGIAYDVFGTGKTVIRGGIAVFRYQVSVNDAGQSASGPQGSFTYTSPSGQNGYAGISGLTNLPTGTEQNGAGISVDAEGDNRTPTTLDWNVTLSQALPWRSVFEVSYVANKSSDELIYGGNGKYDDLNNVLPQAFYQPDPTRGYALSPSPPSCTAPSSLYCVANPNAYATSAFNSNNYRPLVAYQDIYLVTHGSYANYNSLQASWQKQSGPITFITNYTFSKLMGIRDGQSDNGSSDGTLVDPFSLRNNYGPLAYDHTDILNLVYVWNLPKPFHSHALLEGAVNGWQLSGYTTFQSGAPLQPNLNGNLNATFASGLTVPNTEYPGLPDYSFKMSNGLDATAITTSTWFGSNAYQVLLPTLTCNPAQHLKSGQYFNPNCFGVPAYGQQGSSEWPYLRGPSYFDSDLALFKNFRVTDNQKLQIRISATNFLNHPLRQFGLAGIGDEQLNFTGNGCYDSSTGATTLTGCTATQMKLGTGQATVYSSPTNTNATTTGTPGFKTGSRIVEWVAKYYF